MKKYKQLAPEQRYQISALLETKISKTQIATIIGVHKSTIYRELQRNTPKRRRTAERYIADHAQSKTNKRHREKRKLIILTEELKIRIAGLMQHEKWSPERIAKRLAAEGECQISHETIYRWIWMAKHSNRAEHKKFKTLCKH